MTQNEEIKIAEKISEVINRTSSYRCIVNTRDVTNTTRVYFQIDIGGNEGTPKVFPTISFPKSLRQMPYDRINDEIVEQAAAELIDIIQKEVHLDIINTDEFTQKMQDKEFFLHNVVYSLINKKWNKNRNWVTTSAGKDLLYLYHVRVDDCGAEGGAFKVTKDQLERVGLTAKELHKAACENTPKILPASIRPVYQILHKAGIISEEEAKKFSANDEIMWCVTNETGVYGAGAIMYPSVQAELTSRFGNDFVVIPSSVHECLVVHVPEEFIQDASDNLEAMIQEVNVTEVFEEDRLSDKVYVIKSGKLVNI